LTPVKAVISDFGGVLTTPLIESFLAYQRESGISLEDMGVAMGRMMQQDGGRHPLFELEKGNISERDFTARLGAELGREVTSMRDTYFEHLYPNEPMISYLRGLRGDGLRLALLTNNVREWEPLWRAKLPDVEELFEVIVDSAFVGMRKPEPEIYYLTLERLGGGLRFEECLFLDDIEVNCEAARALGMTAVRFHDNEQAIGEMQAALGRQTSGHGG
jgi:putative hydrolase of the HAD superfamily